MQKELANVLKGKLITLAFADAVAGLTQVLTTEELTPDNSTTVIKRRPVSYDVYFKGNLAASCEGKEVALIPSAEWKSIIYFEDYGIAATGTQRGFTGFDSSLRLIAWLDKSKFVADNYSPEIAGRCQAAIIQRLAHKNPENISLFTRLTINVARIPPQDPALFGRYTYEETEKQYLRPPFEFFGIDFSCKYLVSNKCLSEIPWNLEACS